MSEQPVMPNRIVEPTTGPYRTMRLFKRIPIPPLPIGVVTEQGPSHRVLAIVVPSGNDDEDIANAALLSRSWKMHQMLKVAFAEIIHLHLAYREACGAPPANNATATAISDLLEDIKTYAE